MPADSPHELADLLAKFAKSDAQAEQRTEVRNQRITARGATMVWLVGRLLVVAIVTVLGGFVGGWIALADIQESSQTHGAGELAQVLIGAATGATLAGTIAGTVAFVFARRFRS